jgi:VanZ family protein
MRFARAPFTRLSVLMLYLIGMVLATHWPHIDRYAPEGIRCLPCVDKLVHGCLYFGWAALWGWVLWSESRQHRWGGLLGLLLGGLLWAAVDELTQAFVGRQPSVVDFMADLIGLMVGLAIWVIWSRNIIRRRLAAPAQICLSSKGTNQPEAEE